MSRKRPMDASAATMFTRDPRANKCSGLQSCGKRIVLMPCLHAPKLCVELQRDRKYFRNVFCFKGT
jgi:hypothetical protein